MKLLLDVKDEKALFFLEVLKHFKFVKAEKISSSKEEEVLAGIKEAVEEVKLIKAGKLRGIPARDLLNEL